MQLQHQSNYCFALAAKQQTLRVFSLDREHESSVAARQNGVVAVIEGEMDLDGTVFLEFGGGVAGDLIAFVEGAPAEEDEGTIGGPPSSAGEHDV